jgi:L-ribulose-5-phosphate 3-epimerase
MSTSRRTFLKTAAAAPLGATWVQSAGVARTAAAGQPKKCVLVSMLPKGSYAERFTIAREAGFVGTELHTTPNPGEAEEARAAAEKTGLVIHSVMNADHWRFPLSSADPEVVKKSVAGMETSLRNANLWGAGAVLLVPAVVNPETSYAQAWSRSQQVIRERILPLATELKIIVAIEEVWNKFLLSPLEMARYVDEFDSPWVKAYFDVGNVVFYGYPQDWIRVLGARIVRVHLKDFKLDRNKGTFEWKNLGEGDIDWPAVRQALNEINYDNYMTTEISGGDATYLKDVSTRIDRFLAGERPVSTGLMAGSLVSLPRRAVTAQVNDGFSPQLPSVSRVVQTS